MSTNNPIIDVMQARHSVRQYDGQTEIKRSELERLLKTAFLAPTALNLQPIRALVVTSPVLRKELTTATGNMSQLTTASAVVLFVNDRENQDDAQPFQPAQKTPTQAHTDIGALDAGLVAMQFMLLAKDAGYDTNPMTGFDHLAFSQILDLDIKRYQPLLLVSIGMAAQPGQPAKHKSLRQIVAFR
ncbi:nitroreductase family protein [Lactiplantibacillus songbeiensis]|uniref:Nitroreductase family protein n=1 Tax=Lactiplantibacillus songbeiensis TaxID=2559920 RepID=A0ABW4C0N8_9LACO|nr:nitroreductase family protein [Lactiplantibacillus songbeiensis]